MFGNDKMFFVACILKLFFFKNTFNWKQNFFNFLSNEIDIKLLFIKLKMLILLVRRFKSKSIFFLIFDISNAKKEQLKKL